MRLLHCSVVVLAVAVLIPAEARAQQLRAKISQDQARSIALARVPGGTVAASELKVVGGTLVYIYDIAVPGRDGLDELHVSAVDGQVVSAKRLGGGQPDRATQAGQRVMDRTTGPPPQR
jgi:hypothetical protein